MNIFSFRSRLLALAAVLPLTGAALAASTSVNTGSLGAAANGTDGDLVVLNQPGAVAAGGDFSVGYGGGANTTVPFQTALNTAASAPFTIEFWSNPSSSDNDDAAISNRFATGDRSGWTFFQRAAGWNFRMYDGVGGNLGWDLTGGTSNLNEWNHVVVTWTGSAALLYVNGALADDSNDPGASGNYNPNNAINAPVMSIGANFDGGSSSSALMDEIAWYPAALTAQQIASHYTLAGSPVDGLYQQTVRNDGALLQLSNVPEPASAALFALTGAALLRRRRA